MPAFDPARPPLQRIETLMTTMAEHARLMQQTTGQFNGCGMGNLAETLDSLGLPYRFFGFDSAISEVVNYAKQVDLWMRDGGRAEIARHLGIKNAA